MSLRTYQNYEHGEIPYKKVEKIKNLISVYSKNKGVTIDYRNIPSYTTLDLSKYNDDDILMYIMKNLNRFSENTLFNSIIELIEALGLKKEIDNIKKELNQ